MLARGRCEAPPTQVVLREGEAVSLERELPAPRTLRHHTHLRGAAVRDRGRHGRQWAALRTALPAYELLPPDIRWPVIRLP